MRSINTIITVMLILFLLACSTTKRERFNYALIKAKMDLINIQEQQFDEITQQYTLLARAAYESNQGDKKAVKKAVEEIFAEQDAKIKELLDTRQFSIYEVEIKIEREGREKHHMTLIREQLGLDRAQIVKYDLANEAFYALLIDNHDNYHGKPDVYKQYYAEIDLSRQEAFRQLMTGEQYSKYLVLAKEYKLGKLEAY